MIIKLKLKIKTLKLESPDVPVSFLWDNMNTKCRHWDAQYKFPQKV